MSIIKRRKSNTDFYYLKSSSRINGKVHTNEIYLGKTIPSKEKLDQFESILMKDKINDLNSKLSLIRQNFQKDWKKIPESIKEKELMEVAIVFTYNTNAIEGSVITLDETRNLIEHELAPNKPLRDVKETECHAKVFFEMLKHKEKVSCNLLRQWHWDIFKETKSDIAGKFRDYLVRVGGHLAPDWQDLPKLMNDFISFANSKNEFNPVEFAAHLHYKFEKIHPFGDGNGRIGRLLINSILWHAGFPMLIIGFKKRSSYYYALEKSEDYFVNYLIRYYLRAHNKRIK